MNHFVCEDQACRAKHHSIRESTNQLQLAFRAANWDEDHRRDGVEL